MILSMHLMLCTLKNNVVSKGKSERFQIIRVIYCKNIRVTHVNIVLQ